jgi:hypothetical protein
VLLYHRAPVNLGEKQTGILLRCVHVLAAVFAAAWAAGGLQPWDTAFPLRSRVLLPLHTTMGPNLPSPIRDMLENGNGLPGAFLQPRRARATRTP